MACALVFLTTFCLYLRTLCPTVSSGDSGEFLSAALLLDVTHPPGYGMHALAARLAMELPVGGIMFRAGLLSVLAGSFLAVGVFAAGRRISSCSATSFCAAALLAVAPYVWWQSTMLEKYAVQLCLAAVFLATALAGRRMAAVMLFSLALTHHVQALFLLPAFAWLGPAKEWRGARRILLAGLLLLIPLSLKAIYPAVRANAISQREAALTGPPPPPCANWGEPGRFSGLSSYLRLEYYSATLTGPARLLRSSFLEHLAHYPRQLSWPGLLLALAGLALLARSGASIPGALAAIAGTAFCFSLYFPLPPSLSVSYHQNAFLALSLAIPASLAALEACRTGMGRLAAVLCLALATLLALPRARVHDASRHFLIHDFNVSALRLAPPSAVMLGGFEYDIFAPAVLSRSLGLRGDVRPIPAPRNLGPGKFTLRASYRKFSGVRLPGAIRNFSDADPAPRILRRLILDNRSRYCFVMNGLAGPLVPEELFVGRGHLLVARSRPCGEEDPLRPWRAASSRSWFSPERELAPHRVAAELTADCLMRSAMQLPHRDVAGRERLLRVRARIAPDDAAAWLSLASLYQRSGRPPRALACAKRALEYEPDSCAGHALLLGLQLSAAEQSLARDHALALLSRPPFETAPSAERAREALSHGPLDGALPLLWRALAETAQAEAFELPANPEMELRRLRLLRLAAELAPQWPEAQLVYARALLARASYAEAAGYVRRYLKLAPDSPERDRLEALLLDR